jgi:hypothetical protein
VRCAGCATCGPLSPNAGGCVARWRSALRRIAVTACSRCLTRPLPEGPANVLSKTMRQYSASGIADENVPFTHYGVDMDTPRLTHVRINVRDLAAAIEWYERLLGVPAEGHWPPESPTYAHHRATLRRPMAHANSRFGILTARIGLRAGVVVGRKAATLRVRCLSPAVGLDSRVAASANLVSRVWVRAATRRKARSQPRCCQRWATDADALYARASPGVERGAV